LLPAAQQSSSPAGVRSGGAAVYLWQYRIILSADTTSEVRQMLSQKRR